MSKASERRAATRFEIFAQANVVSGRDSYLLSVRNISASGAFLEGLPKDHPELKPGVQIEVTLSATAPGMADDEIVNINYRGKIERVELGTATRSAGFGVALEPLNAAERERLEDLLSRLADIPPPLRTSSLG